MHRLRSLTDKHLPIDFWLGHHSLILLLLQQRQNEAMQDINYRFTAIPTHTHNCRLDLVNNARAQTFQIFEVLKLRKVKTRLN